MRNIQFSDFDQPQSYFIHPQFSDEILSLLFDMRCRTVRGIKDNFHGMYKKYECDLCNFTSQNQEHLMECLPLLTRVQRDNDVQYSDIFGIMDQQAKIVEFYSRLLVEKEKMGAVPTGANKESSGPCITLL